MPSNSKTIPSLFFVAALTLLSPHALFAQTSTSTSSNMPEDGGPLPRARMPEGGVGDRAAGPETPDELPRAQMPEGGANLHCHLHEHHGVEHSHCHDHDANESHDHPHENDQHCHEHEHGGTAHNHCHGHETGREHRHEHPEEEHCHPHEHADGTKHDHCHDEDGAADHAHHDEGEDCHEHDGESHCHDARGGPHEHKGRECHDHGDAEHCHEAGKLPHDHDGEDCHEHDGQEHCHPDGERPHAHGTNLIATSGAAADARLGASGIKLQWNGYLRTVAEFIENDPRSTFIGRNDGFKLINARLGLRASTGNFFSYVSFDAAAGAREQFNDTNADFAVRLRDAYMSYGLSRFADLFAGRFKAPYDLSALQATGALTFIDRPVESRGVLPGTGFELDGMTQGRQLGVMVSKSRIGLTEDGFDIGYALALTNGRTPGLALNDNDRPALFGRVSAYYSDWAVLNVAGFTDTRTVGELPDLFDEDVSGTEVSAVVRIDDLVLEAQFLFQSTSFDGERPTVNTLGLHAQWAYTLWGVTLAYRFAWYEPNTEDLDDADQRTEHTLGLSYGLEKIPLRFMLNGTVAGEQVGRKLDNNRLALLAQFLF